jgi:hypothetical protein
MSTGIHQRPNKNQTGGERVFIGRAAQLVSEARRCVTAVWRWAWSWKTAIVWCQGLSSVERDLCSPWNGVAYWRRARKEAEIYKAECRLARAPLGGGRAEGSVRREQQSDSGMGREKSRGEKSARPLSGVYNGIARSGTRTVGICWGTLPSFFRLPARERVGQPGTGMRAMGLLETRSVWEGSPRAFGGFGRWGYSSASGLEQRPALGVPSVSRAGHPDNSRSNLRLNSANACTTTRRRSGGCPFELRRPVSGSEYMPA